MSRLVQSLTVVIVLVPVLTGTARSDEAKSPHPGDLVRKLDAALDRDAPPQELRALVDAVAELGPDGKEAAPALVRALDNPFLTDAALRALAAIQPDAMIIAPRLLELLRESSRAEPVAALANLGASAKTFVPELVAALDHEELHVRVQVARAIARIDPANARANKLALATLLRAVEERIPFLVGDVKVQLAVALSERPGDIPAVLALLKPEKPARVRANALDVLADCGPEARLALPMIRRALDDESSQVRTAAASLVAQAWEPGDDEQGIATKLANLFVETKEKRALFDEGFGPFGRHSERMAASFALIHLGPDAKDAVPMLVAAVKDRLDRSESAVFEIEVLASTNPNPKHVMGLLKSALKSDDLGNGVYAMRALGRIGPEAKSCAPIIAAALAQAVEKWPERELELDRKYGLGRHDGTIIIEEWNDWTGVYLDSLEALGQIGGDLKEILPLQLAGLANDIVGIRRAAAKSLAACGPDAQKALPALAGRLSRSMKQSHEDPSHKLAEWSCQAELAAAILSVSVKLSPRDFELLGRLLSVKSDEKLWSAEDESDRLEELMERIEPRLGAHGHKLLPKLRKLQENDSLPHHTRARAAILVGRIDASDKTVFRCLLAACEAELRAADGLPARAPWSEGLVTNYQAELLFASLARIGGDAEDVRDILQKARVHRSRDIRWAAFRALQLKRDGGEPKR